MISSLLELPHTGAYLNRIGAEPIHFHLATISQMVNGYPKVVGRVRFTDEGEIKPWGTADKPTDAEREAIAAEFASAEFPKIITLAAINDPPPGCDLNAKETFVCHDFDGNIIMVHQRYQNQDGSKGFLPWTKWSDGQWRKMEPDIMPFYGLPGAKEHSTLFLHEGSKAAGRVKRMLAGDEEVGRFPWLEELRWGAHIGWIGGVHAVDRSDWRKLAAMNWKRVVIVADNDAEGRAVLPQISEHFRCPVWGLVFTNDWPERFDLADDWPEEMFGDDGQYTGPPFSHCLQPATFATEQYEIPPTGRQTRPTVVVEIRHEFAEQWCWVEKQDLMVNKEMPQYRMTAPHFNAFIRPFSHAKDTLGHFQKHYSGNQMELTYDPSKEGTIVRDAAGLQSINLYSPPAIKPTPGDWQPWIDYLEHMFPVESDRKAVARWAATLIAQPKIRMIYGLLMMSVSQGVGKGTFARVLSELVGNHNASFPSASLIVDSQFNGWVNGKRLIIVDEIYEGHSWKAYNKLKPYVTDDKIEVNVKNEKTWSMPNWTHYILMSNSRAALKLEAADRRWLVPEVTEEVWSEERFGQFYDWMRSGGLSAVAYWAHSFVDRGEGKYVRPGEVAPMSNQKARLIVESRSDMEQLAQDLADVLLEASDPIAVALSSVKPWAEDRLRGKVYETPHALARSFRNYGIWITERIKVGKSKESLLVNNEEMLGWEPSRLRQLVKSPSDLLDEPM